MKSLPLFCALGLLCSTPVASRAAITPQNNILGKFVVTSVNGTATCVTDGRILELKKGDTIVARGATVSTGPGANVIMVFSNGTGVYTDENTRLKIERFDQEFFAPNNNLRIEPSNSTTRAKLISGRVVLSTPQLLSGTSMIYQTPHASVGIRGNKLVIEAAEEFSNIALIDGNATVNHREEGGGFVAVGRRISGGEEALVKFTHPGAKDPGRNQPSTAATPGTPPPVQDPASPPPAAGPTADSQPAEVAAVVVLKMIGTARTRLPGAAEETEVTDGARLAIGSIISTGNDSLLFLQPYPGAITAVMPHSVLEVEQLKFAGEGAPAPRRSATLTLRDGSVMSMLDPAGHLENEYTIRTPQGTATARGTVFNTSIQNGSMSVATTADTVTFTSATGQTYQVSAGNVVIANPGQNPQPPIPLVQAVAMNPGFEAMIQTAFATVTTIVKNNLGGFSPGASANLLSQVTATAAVALPDQAESFAAQAVAAIGTPSSSLSSELSPSIAAVLQAVVGGLPDRATPTATAAALATVPQAAVVAAAAAKAAPARAPQIAAAVARLVLKTDTSAGITAASLQTAAAIAASVAASTPTQAGVIARATMQTVLEANPNSTPLLNAQRGAFIAATVTRATPAQAVGIARSMMQLLSQNWTEPTPQTVAQTAAVLAGSIIAVVPAQARPVATAVMIFLIETYPTASNEWFAEVAGVLAATLAQLSPANAQEIYAGIADALGQSLDYVQLLALRFDSQASQFAREAAAIGRDSALAFQEGSMATDALAAGLELARGPAGFPLGTDGGSSIEISSATSIAITQFDPAEVAQLTLDLAAAQAAQTSVQFYTETSDDGGTTVRPSPTIPRTLPVDLLVSPSTLSP